MTSIDYWEECIAQAMEEAEIKATSEQITLIAHHVEGAHECYGMAFYQPENPLIGELAETKLALKRERSKVHCDQCNGSGSITTPGPYRSSTSQCWKCHGEGRISL